MFQRTLCLVMKKNLNGVELRIVYTSICKTINNNLKAFVFQMMLNDKFLEFKINFKQQLLFLFELKNFLNLCLMIDLFHFGTTDCGSRGLLQTCFTSAPRTAVAGVYCRLVSLRHHGPR